MSNNNGRERVNNKIFLRYAAICIKMKQRKKYLLVVFKSECRRRAFDIKQLSFGRRVAALYIPISLIKYTYLKQKNKSLLELRHENV